MADLSDTLQAPPPWQLTGSGTILLFRFPRDFVIQHGCIPSFLTGRYRGGLGAVMLVDYFTSPVGPYREALLIPGTFRHAKKNYYSITQIAVSTLASVVNGRQNWGIPKTLANFDVETLPNGTQHFAMHVDNQPALDIATRTRGPQLPFNTRWLPFRPTIIQQRDDGQLLTTAPFGKGRVQLAQLDHITVNPDQFPDFSELRPVGVVRATQFELTFPLPATIPNGAEDADR